MALKFTFATGTYVGNGTDNHAITGIGFQPDLIIIKRDGSAMACFKSTTHAGNNSQGFTDFERTDAIKSFDVDGFTVGTRDYVNDNTYTYRYMCYKIEDANFVKLGTYTGTGIDDLTITGLGFTPDYIIVKRAAASDGAIHTCRAYQENDTGKSIGIQGGFSPLTDGIKSLDADGFTVGVNTAVNVNTETYHYIAFKRFFGEFMDGTYVGDGNDNRNIVAMGFSPKYLIVQRIGNSGARHRSTVITTDKSMSIQAGIDLADTVQSLNTNGFQIGTHASVNNNADTYFWAAFGQFTNGTKAFDIISGTYVGNGIARTISGIGFYPDFMFIKGTDVGRGCVFKFAGHTDKNSQELLGGERTDAIIGFTSDGFKLDTFIDVNENGTTFRYICFKIRSAAYVDIGSYVGNGTDDHAIDWLENDPDFVMVKRASNLQDATITTTSFLGVNPGEAMTVAGSATLGRIKSLDTNGFTLGTATLVNANNAMYHFIAFKRKSNQFKDDVYTGDGLDNRNITGVGFQPVYGWVNEDGASDGRHKSDSNIGEVTMALTSLADDATNVIQAFLADGFQIGSSDDINQNGLTYLYIMFAPGDLFLDVSDSLSPSDILKNESQIVKIDSAVISDSTIREAQSSKSENVGISDTIEKEAQPVKTEIVGASDSRISDVSALELDSLAVVDVIKNEAQIPKLDSLTIADIIKNETQLLKADSLALSDATVIKNIGILKLETVGLVDNLLKESQALITEVVSLIEALSNEAQLVKTDSLGLNDTTVDVIRILDLAESLGLAEQVKRDVETIKIESLTIVDALAIEVNYVLNLISSLTIIEQITQKNIEVMKMEAVLLADNIAKDIVIMKTENVSLVDILIKNVNIIKIESLALADIFRKFLQAMMLETLGLSDTTIIKDMGILKTDNIVLADVINKFFFIKLLDNNISLIDITVKDFVTKKIENINIADGLSNELNKLLEDSTIIIDATIYFDVNKFLTESLGIIDVAQAYEVISLIEQIPMIETFNIFKIPAIPVGDRDDYSQIGKADEEDLVGEYNKPSPITRFDE